MVAAGNENTPRPLRVLLLEDNNHDAELMLRELRREGFQPDARQVSTEDGFVAALDSGVEVILADYAMPKFNGLRALELLKKSGLKIPFIVVSGSIGEEFAVSTIKQGATDYLLKDRLARLGPAVTQALEQTRLRAERRLAEEHLRARDEAERSNLAKSEFLSRMSHELRTPLNSILGFGQLLELDNLTEKQHASVEHILTSGRHLLNLINEVLDITGVESGHIKIVCERLEMHRVVRETVALVRPLAVQRGLDLQLPETLGGQGAPAAEGPFVFADEQRLKQILLNLLSNAIKYNVPGGRITLAYQVTPDFVRLRVTDTGRGITPDMRERLFTPFDRLGAETTGVEGTGLGLTLSRRLIESMGGNLGIEDASAPEAGGPGTTFWLEVPLASGSVGDEAAARRDAELVASYEALCSYGVM